MTRSYTLDLAKETSRVLGDALSTFLAFNGGDFQFVGKMRLTRVDGTEIPKEDHAEVLNDLTQVLPTLLFGTTSEPDAASYAEMASRVTEIQRQLEASMTLMLSTKQCALVCTVSEFYARLFTGQLEYALDYLTTTGGCFAGNHAEVRAICTKVKRLLFGLESSVSLGVGHRAASADKDISWDIYEVVRHRLAWDRHPGGGMTVDFGRPMHWHKGVPAVIIKEAT